MRILLILLLAFQMNAQQQKVHATVYNPVHAQTNSDPSHTATIFYLDLKNPYKHKQIAVSRDLLKQVPYQSKLVVKGTAYDGVYIIEDTMNKRYTNRIDLLINLEMRIGSWKDVTITKLR